MISYTQQAKQKKKVSRNSKQTVQKKKVVKQKSYQKYNAGITAKNKRFKTGSRVKDRMSTATYFAGKPQNPQFADHNANMARKDLVMTGGRNMKLLFNKTKPGGTPLPGGGFSSPLWGGRKKQTEIAKAYGPSWKVTPGKDHIAKSGNVYKNRTHLSDNQAREYVQAGKRSGKVVLPTSTRQSITGAGKKPESKKSGIDRMMDVFDALSIGNYAVHGATSGALRGYKDGKGNVWQQRKSIAKGAKAGMKVGIKASTSSDKRGRYSWFDSLKASDKNTQDRLKREGKYRTSDMMSPLIASQINKRGSRKFKERTDKQQREAERSMVFGGLGLDLTGFGIASKARAGSLFGGSSKLSKGANRIARAGDLTIDVPVMSLLRGSGKAKKALPKSTPESVRKFYDIAMKDLSKTHAPKSQTLVDTITGSVANKLNKPRGFRNINRGVAIGGFELMSPDTVRKIGDSKFNLPGRYINEAVNTLKSGSIKKSMSDTHAMNLVNKEIAKAIKRGGITQRQIKTVPRALLANAEGRQKQISKGGLRTNAQQGLGGLGDRPLAERGVKTNPFTGASVKDIIAGRKGREKAEFLNSRKAKLFSDTNRGLHESLAENPNALDAFKEARQTGVKKDIVGILNNKLFGGKPVIANNVKSSDLEQFMNYMEDGLSHKRALDYYNNTGKITNFRVRSHSKGKVISIPIANKRGVVTQFEPKYNMFAQQLTDPDYFKKTDLMERYMSRDNLLSNAEFKKFQDKLRKKGTLTEKEMTKWSKHHKARLDRQSFMKRIEDMSYKEAQAFLRGEIGSPDGIYQKATNASPRVRQMAVGGIPTDRVPVRDFERALENGDPIKAFMKQAGLDVPKPLTKTDKVISTTDKLLKPYDLATREFKSGVTVGRPGWHGFNWIQNKTLSGYDIGMDVFNTDTRRVAEKVVNFLDPKSIYGKEFGKQFVGKELDDVMRIGNKTFKNSDGTAMKMRDFVRAIDHSGIIDSTLMKDVSGKTKGGLKQYLLPSGEKSVFTAGGLHNAIRTESYDKLNHVVARMNMGDNITDAIASAQKYMFDYEDLNKFEEKVLKRIIPFYTYHSKNIPVQIQRAVDNPATIARYARTLQNTEKGVRDEDYIGRDEWTQNRVQIPGTNMVDPTRGKNTDHAMFVRPGSPYDAVLELPQNNIKTGDLGILPTYNPLAESVVRYFGTRKDFFGNEFTDKDAKGFAKYFNEQVVQPSLGSSGEVAKIKKTNKQYITQNEALQYLKLLTGINAKYYKSPQQYKDLKPMKQEDKKKQITLRAKYK